MALNSNTSPFNLPKTFNNGTPKTLEFSETSWGTANPTSSNLADAIVLAYKNQSPTPSDAASSAIPNTNDKLVSTNYLYLVTLAEDYYGTPTLNGIYNIAFTINGVTYYAVQA